MTGSLSTCMCVHPYPPPPSPLTPHHPPPPPTIPSSHHHPPHIVTATTESGLNSSLCLLSPIEKTRGAPSGLILIYTSPAPSPHMVSREITTAMKFHTVMEPIIRQLGSGGAAGGGGGRWVGDAQKDNHPYHVMTCHQRPSQSPVSTI